MRMRNEIFVGAKVIYHDEQSGDIECVVRQLPYWTGLEWRVGITKPDDDPRIWRPVPINKISMPFGLNKINYHDIEIFGDGEV